MKNKILKLIEERKSDILTRLKNGSASKHPTVRLEQREELRNRMAELNVITMKIEEL
jgi:hypothetical protein|tara:strand:- start:624 stop:794 length:171 start_codon:yes stop_codon:yes gene_type:complete